MKYFSNFPTIQYDSELAVNITSRYKPLESLLSKVKLFYDYRIKDGDTPHIVSHKFYDTYEHHDLIMLFNKIYDPYFDWPLSYNQFSDFIDKKYGSEQYAKQTVKHYYRVVTNDKLENGTLVKGIKDKIQYETYITLDDNERDLIYIYDYENELNERKRNIKIIDSIYLPAILKEKAKIFK